MLVIFNPTAGRGHHARVTAMVGLLRQRQPYVHVHNTTCRGDAERVAAQAAAHGHSLIIAAGGDGTVNEVLNGLADAPLALAIYPVGTTNVLAHEIGMPLDPAAFVNIIATVAPSRAWIGEISGRRFALMASIGFDARVVDQVNYGLKRHIGKGAYVVKALQNLARHAPVRYNVTIDGELSYDAGAIVVAKSRYYGGKFSITPDSSITLPFFYVCLFNGHRRFDVIRYAHSLVRNRVSSLSDVLIMPANTVSLTGPSNEPIQIDGDVQARTPAVAHIAAPIALIIAGAGLTS